MVVAVDMRHWVKPVWPKSGVTGAFLVRVREERKAARHRGLSETEWLVSAVADALRIDRSSMSSYERGRTIPPPEVCDVLADYYDLTPAELVELDQAVRTDNDLRARARARKLEPLTEPALAIGPVSPELRLVLTRIAEKDLEAKHLLQVAAFVENIEHLDTSIAPAPAKERSRRQQAG